MIGLASPGVNANSDNANFGPGVVNNGIANSGNNNLFNSDGNWNANGYAVRPVDSINCGYAINDCIRDNIETNYCPFIVNISIKMYLFIFENNLAMINKKKIDLFVSNFITKK